MTHRIETTQAPTKPRGMPCFSLWHLIGLGLVWFPLNPFTLYLIWSLLSPRYAVGSNDLADYSRLIVPSILGPFTATLEGRNRDFCFEVAWRVLPVCLGALLVATLLQVLWRPHGRLTRGMRLWLWMTGWFVWFCGALVSVVSNSG
ncbi:hypothetical protein GC163_15650 [bacterium]|nr:hypothetical protein [bacterium]